VKAASPVSHTCRRRGARVALLAVTLTLSVAPAGAHATRVRPPGADRAWVATVIYRTRVRASPRGNASSRGLVPAVSQWGTPMTVLVLASRVGPEGRTWLRVLLDRRPNDRTVWLNSEDTLLRIDRWRITVSLRARQVSVFRAGRIVRSFTAVVGKPSTPTPTGLFAVAAALRQPDANLFEGSWVLPLTAHSDVLERFDGGDGQVALHGRGGASLIDPLGTARSHGCVRLANRAIAWIATHVPLGTPVRVV
jgi:lipoprotein-anchoring transpeptidase ErfK/SrfK